MANADIGLIGLGVMGQNLALNIERNGYPIAVYDREPAVLDAFIARAAGKQIFGAHTPEQFGQSLKRPRKIILLVKAGDPTDWTINLIKPFLDQGDIIIDGGNSYFKDTERREQELKSDGFFMLGSGTSGGEKGATHTVTGPLDLLGIKKTVTFPATINVAADAVSVASEFAINRKDFGIVYAGKADDLIRDEVVLKLAVKAPRR